MDTYQHRILPPPSRDLARVKDSHHISGRGVGHASDGQRRPRFLEPYSLEQRDWNLKSFHDRNVSLGGNFVEGKSVFGKGSGLIHKTEQEKFRRSQVMQHAHAHARPNLGREQMQYDQRYQKTPVAANHGPPMPFQDTRDKNQHLHGPLRVPLRQDRADHDPTSARTADYFVANHDHVVNPHKEAMPANPETRSYKLNLDQYGHQFRLQDTLPGFEKPFDAAHQKVSMLPYAGATPRVHGQHKRQFSNAANRAACYSSQRHITDHRPNRRVDKIYDQYISKRLRQAGIKSF